MAWSYFMIFGKFAAFNRSSAVAHRVAPDLAPLTLSNRASENYWHFFLQFWHCPAWICHDEEQRRTEDTHLENFLHVDWCVIFEKCHYFSCLVTFRHTTQNKYIRFPAWWGVGVIWEIVFAWSFDDVIIIEGLGMNNDRVCCVFQSIFTRIDFV